MVGNASYSSSLSALSGMSPSSWFMDSACCNHITPHSSLFSELKPAPHSLNIRTANGSTMSGHNIGSVSTSNDGLTVPESFDSNSRKPKQMNAAKKNTKEDKDCS